MSMELDPRADRLRETIDRSTLEHTRVVRRECRDFIWPGGTALVHRVRVTDGMDRIFVARVRGRGIEFRRSIVQRWRILATPRFYFCPQPRPRRVVR